MISVFISAQAVSVVVAITRHVYLWALVEEADQAHFRSARGALEFFFGCQIYFWVGPGEEGFQGP